MRINGHLLPGVSGIGNLGSDVNLNGSVDSIAPFSRVHLMSGIFHDPVSGTSGVLRFNPAGQFQVSLDGGRTFSNIRVGSAVTDIGVIGGPAISSSVDLATPASGFMTIQDTGGSSPLLFSVNVNALSGLWRFPAQGFNSSIVNSLTDGNGTTAHGAITVTGASGIYVDTVGQIMTIVPGGTICRGYSEYIFSDGATINHNLNTENIIVNVFNPGKEIIFDFTLTIINTNRFDIVLASQAEANVVVVGF